MWFFIIFVTEIYSASPKRVVQKRVLNFYALASIATFMDLSDKVRYYLNSPLLVRDNGEVFTVLHRLKVQGGFDKTEDAVEDFIRHNLPELESSVPARFNPFYIPNASNELLHVMNDYLEGSRKPLWKFLPGRWRACYDHLLRPGPTFDINLGDVTFEELDSVYAILESNDASPPGPRELQVDETLDKQFFIFKSPKADSRKSERFFVEKSTGKSVWSIAKDRLPFHWIPSARSIILDDVKAASVWYLRADTSKEATKITGSHFVRWNFILRGNSLVDFFQGVEIPLDHHKEVRIGVAIVREFEQPYEVERLKASVSASVCERGIITIFNILSRAIISELKCEVNMATPDVFSYLGGSEHFRLLQSVVKSKYDWTLVKEFIAATRWRKNAYPKVVHSLLSTAQHVKKGAGDHHSTHCTIS